MLPGKREKNASKSVNNIIEKISFSSYVNDSSKPSDHNADDDLDNFATGSVPMLQAKRSRAPLSKRSRSAHDLQKFCSSSSSLHMCENYQKALFLLDEAEMDRILSTIK